MSGGARAGRLTGAIVTLVLLSLAVPATGLALPGVLAVNGSLHFKVRPASISYTGDGTGFVGGFDGTGERNESHTGGNFGHITWTSWTAQSASGTGALWGDDCEPNCAEGSFSAVPVTIRVFAPHGGHFTLLRLNYESEGRRYKDERRAKYVPESPGFYEYGPSL